MEEDIEKDLSSSDVLDKYKAAAEIANAVMGELLEFIQPGQNVVDICDHGDKLITDACAKKFQKIKKNKGIAWPTCVSVNNCAGHFSPLPADGPAVILKEGDVVKIDLGVHIDGYLSQCAHTIVLGHNPEVPLTGKVADAICAAYFIGECVIRLLRPGKTNNEVTQVIQKICETFKVNPVEGVLSHEVSRNVIDGNNVILQKPAVDQTVEEFKFEINKAYVIDIVISTGEGKTRELEARTTVFKRAIDRNYQLRLQSSRAVFYEITQKSPFLPFSMRSLDEKKRKMAISDMLKHDLLDTYPVLYEREGEFIVQFKFTVLMVASSTMRLNNFPLPHVTSEFSIDNNPEIQAILALSTKRKKKAGGGKKKKKANNKNPDSNPNAMEVEEDEEDEE